MVAVDGSRPLIIRGKDKRVHRVLTMISLLMNTERLCALPTKHFRPNLVR